MKAQTTRTPVVVETHCRASLHRIIHRIVRKPYFYRDLSRAGNIPFDFNLINSESIHKFNSLIWCYYDKSVGCVYHTKRM